MASTTVEEVLRTIRESGSEGIAPEDIVLKLEAAKSTVTKFVNQLESQELIRRNGEKVYSVLRRGRRLIATEERDENVFSVIQDSGENGISMQEVATALGIESGLAYQSVYRLRRYGRIYRVGITRTARWRTQSERAA